MTFYGSRESASAYADHIEENYSNRYNQYSWLVNFLRNGHTEHSANYLSLSARIFIIDSEEDRLTSKLFKVSNDDSIPPDLVKTLADESSSRQTRLIFVQYQDFESLNPAILDQIGTVCNLHPDFFSVHFECEFDQNGRVVAHYASHSLPSERRFLQIRTDESTFMTTTWDISDKQTTFIVLSLDHFLGSADQLTTLHDQLLNHTSHSEISRLNEFPADYLYPYIREAARRGASINAQLAPFREVDGQKPSAHDIHLDTKWETNQRNRRAMMSSVGSLRKFLANLGINPEPGSLQLSAIVDDYEELIRESEMIAQDLGVLLQQQANLASIEQARKSVVQTDSVRRLSVVAFVFIPLSFTSSFFGMNLTELGSGPLSIGYFFLLAVLSGALCILLGVFLGDIERWMDVLWRSVGRRSKIWKTRFRV